jgi:hypothetical protein
MNIKDLSFLTEIAEAGLVKVSGGQEDNDGDSDIDPAVQDLIDTFNQAVMEIGCQTTSTDVKSKKVNFSVRCPLNK